MDLISKAEFYSKLQRHLVLKNLIVFIINFLVQWYKYSFHLKHSCVKIGYPPYPQVYLFLLRYSCRSKTHLQEESVVSRKWDNIVVTLFLSITCKLIWYCTVYVKCYRNLTQVAFSSDNVFTFVIKIKELNCSIYFSIEEFNSVLNMVK